MDLSTAPAIVDFPFPGGQLLDPPGEFAELRSRSPVRQVRLWDGSTPWLVTGHAEARALLGDARLSVSRHRPGFPFPNATRQVSERLERSFIVMDAPDHGRYRKMFTKYFAIRRIEQLRPVVERFVDDLIDRMLADGPVVDLVDRLAQQVPSHLMCHLLGLDPADREYFQARDVRRNTLSSTGDDVTAATREVLVYLDRVVAAKQANPGDDLISALIADQVESGNLDRDLLVAMIRHLLAAGHDSTTQMIGLGTLTLLRHPDQFEALGRDPALAPGAVEELLRYIPLFQISPNRVAVADVEVAGVVIRAGDGVILPPAAANRDPAAFPEPDRFDIRRDAGGHVAFAFGPHQCLGQSLARIELQTVFARLPRRIPALRLAVDAGELEFSDYLLLSLTRLPVTWTDTEAERGGTDHAGRR